MDKVFKEVYQKWVFELIQSWSLSFHAEAISLGA